MICLFCLLCIQCGQKKGTKMFFCNISYKRAIPILYTVSWINLLQRYVNIFNLTWIMSLDYLVKLEMSIMEELPLHCQRRNSRIYPTSTVWEILQERCTKHALLICSYQRRHWRMAAAMTTWSCLDLSVLSHCFSSSRSVIHASHIFSCSIPTRCYQLDSNLANSQATVEVGWILEFLYLTTQL